MSLEDKGIKEAGAEKPVRKIGKIKDPLANIITGIIFICAGTLIFADKQGYLEASWFWWFMFLVGLVLLIEALVRSTLRKFNKPINSRIVWGAILVGLGGGQITGLDNWWPLILIIAGIVMIVNSTRSKIRKQV